MENPLVFMDSKDASCTSFEDEPNTSFNRETNNSEDNKITGQDAGATGDIKIKPKSIQRAKAWSDEVENLYRFQQAGYRDEIEYKQVKHVDAVDRWPETGFVKKLQRRDNTYYYYDKERECEDKEVHKVKVYAY